MGKTESFKNRQRCPSKKYGWDDKAEALIALMNARGRSMKRVYECNLCGRYHFTVKTRGANGYLPTYQTG